ncbi:MAG: NAD(+) synthase [Tepidanaerobacter acetatoxydans]|uniref:NAD(+) synthase n=1 Tax=Tepidanaerobacter TaxID=499228 RepID=UPI000AC1465C|nr:NAD(+) synthase [Tepidanaerobacter sp. EBM-38]NLU10881.1 NAD(+) synthase [Tepidanaerobacter acetatoxydans]
MDVNELCDSLVTWLKEYTQKAGALGAVFGMSGGIDSAVVSVLCKRAFGENTLGLIMPCYSDKNDEMDAKLIADKFDIKYQTIILDGIYDEFLKVMDKSENQMAKANIKPRLRMIALYYYAALNHYLVVGSENKSELTVGYFTKYGDGGADLWPIGNLVKGQVKMLAAYLGIPQKIIDKVPTAGLWSGQSDEKEMGITYDELDRYILTGETINPEIRDRIRTLYIKSEHKRRLAQIPEFKLN